MGVGIPEEVVLRVDRAAAGGRAVGRVGGVVWMVSGAVPGDTVRARVERRHSRWIAARAVELLTPSPERRAVPCPIQGACGGCPWMPLAIEAQRRAKRALVADALSRIGGFGSVEVDEVLPSPRELGYRGKIELTLERRAEGEGAVVLGFHSAAASRDLVDVERCPVADPRVEAVLGTVRASLLTAAVAAGGRTRIALRASRSSGEVLVAVRGAAVDASALGELARRLAAGHPEVVGVVHVRARPGRRGGARTTTLHGRSWIEEELGGTRFRLPAASFFQVNPDAADLVVERVAASAAARRGTRVLDLYGGVGVYGWRLAADGAEVVVCEADAGAVDCGRAAAPRGPRATRPRFVRADAGRYLATREAAPGRFDVVVANPPRTGLGRGVAEKIAALSPERIVIVSCDPATLARDLRELGRRGFSPRRVTPVDLFPQTAHVETVCRLER